MTMAELRRDVREVYVESNVQAVKALLDLLLTFLNEPGAQAAGLRAVCVRAVLEIVEEIREVTG